MIFFLGGIRVMIGMGVSAKEIASTKKQVYEIDIDVQYL